MKIRQEKPAAKGSVKTQVKTSLRAVFHSTPGFSFAKPTPVILPTIICVELMGIPKKLANKMIKEELLSAANP